MIFFFLQVLPEHMGFLPQFMCMNMLTGHFKRAVKVLLRCALQGVARAQQRGVPKKSEYLSKIK